MDDLVFKAVVILAGVTSTGLFAVAILKPLSVGDPFCAAVDHGAAIRAP